LIKLRSALINGNATKRRELKERKSQLFYQLEEMEEAVALLDSPTSLGS
jgi:hypothetical protein